MCPQCGEIKLEKEFFFKKGSSTHVGRICLTCKSSSSSREYISTSISRHPKRDDEPSRGDMNKLLSFSENPEKYATGTSRANEKIKYLESIKHKLSEGQLKTYTAARKKYDTALTARTNLKSSKADYDAVLTEAFNGHRSVKIQYKGSWRTIDPYSLNRTYIVAYCHFARDIRTFRVDRIQGAELAEVFNFDKSLQTAAQSKLVAAPSYQGNRGYRH